LPCVMNALTSISLWPISIMRAAKCLPACAWRSRCDAASLCLNGVSRGRSPDFERGGMVTGFVIIITIFALRCPMLAQSGQHSSLL
jgi:hypothetical protein